MRQEHEPEIARAAEDGRHLIRLPGHAEKELEHSLDQQGNAESQQQAVERVETVELPQKRSLQHCGKKSNDQRSDDKAGPETEAGMRSEKESREGTDGVEHA